MLHSEETEEEAEKYLSDKSVEGTSAELIRAVDHFLKDAKKSEDVTITIQVNSTHTSSTKIDAPLIYNLFASVWNIKNPSKKIPHAKSLEECKAFNFQAKISDGPNFCILRTGFAGNLLKNASSEEKEMVAKELLNFIAAKIKSWSPKKPKKNKFQQSEIPEISETDKQSLQFQKMALAVIAQVGNNKLTNACLRELFELSDQYEGGLSQDVQGYLRDFDVANLLDLSAAHSPEPDKLKTDFKAGL